MLNKAEIIQGIEENLPKIEEKKRKKSHSITIIRKCFYKKWIMREQERALSSEKYRCHIAKIEHSKERLENVSVKNFPRSSKMRK